MIPLNFVVGAAVGAAGTYLAKDESARQWVIATGKKVKNAAVSVIESMKKKTEVPTATVATAETDSGQTVEGSVVAEQAAQPAHN